MSVVAAALRELVALGVSGDALVAAIERIEEAAVVERARSMEQAVEIATRKEDAKLAARKAKAAERTRKWREGNDASPSVTVTSPSVTDHHSDDQGARLTCEPARVETLTSSLRSEDTSEAKASSVSASKPAPPEKPKTKPPKSERGTRLPEDWEPTEADVTVARAEGLTDEEIHRAAVEFRNYWSARSRDATRLSWPKTWHNRVIEIGDRKRRYRARLAASPGQPGGGRRGAGSFADIYARRHGIAAE